MNTIDSTVRDQNISTVDAASGAVDQSTLLSVDKALSIVELLMRRAEPLSARAIAEEAGINRTTTHRLLNALIHRGWIEKPPGTASYRLGLKFVALAHVGSIGRSFLEEVRPAMEHLSRLSRETVHLGVLDGYEVLHVDKIESLERVGIASKVGSRGVPHTTGLGKALLAASPDDFLDDYLAHAASEDGPIRVVDPAAFRAEIARTRERGYSVDDEEDSIGVRCLGVAVLGAGGSPLFAISLTGPSPRFTRERVAAYAPEAMATARALSRQLGWEPAGETTEGRDGSTSGKT
ncbi:MAG: IclR family transcriptional regulator, regulon repressor [Thermomicrobiales bacterium]|nr:IclR family transcriptional regulator, regulon repressor [Thermomicrobiales bacterium]